MQRLIGGGTFNNVYKGLVSRGTSRATATADPWLYTPLSFRRHATTTLNFQELDQKWQKRWTQRLKAEEPVSGTGTEAGSDYILAMFPYPSGALHMGHVRVYTIADVLARFKRMQGYGTSRNVIYPMGWDAFGLPAENAAIERGLDPAEWTKSNITKMKDQLQGMNTDIDWSRELITCSPEFYKHTQRIFLLLHEHGMAYQAESLVNYDPIDRTVLANEQVDSNGRSWRSGAKVEKLNLKQWFFKITDFKDELLQDLKLLTRWPERVIAMQQNWLGRSTGTKLSFDIISEIEGSPKTIPVFTTRLDTLLGAQFLAVSSTHPLVVEHAKYDQGLESFLRALPDLPDGSKSGYHIRGISARNPLAAVPGCPSFVQEPLSIWVAPYVKSDYGEGAVMGVPAHDERDFAFWKTNCGHQAIRPVIKELDGEEHIDTNLQEPFTSRGRLRRICGSYTDLSSDEAAKKIFHDLTIQEAAIENTETWRLRDWLISRQRYWGTPIPIIHCTSCGPVPVPVHDLPVELPALKSDTFKHRKGNPLEQAEDWINVKCPKCNQPARRDTDTMDTFVDSSWYMFRFIDPQNSAEPFSAAKADKYMPVSTYVGGIEHAILHLLYARFIGKFLAKIGMWPEGNSELIHGEPFGHLISQGMVHGKTFSDPDTGRFLKPEEMDLTQPSRPLIRSSRKTPNITFEKMSKSKYNGVDPTDVISRYGADVTRVHMLFQAPVSEVLEWEEARIVGVQRWLVRMHKHIESVASLLAEGGSESSKSTSNTPFGKIEIGTLSQNHAQLYLKTEQTVASITTALSETNTLNTCISDLMTLTNDLTSTTSEQRPAPLLYHTSSTLIKLLAPFAPAFAEEMWEILHENLKLPNLRVHSTTSLFDFDWPISKNVATLESWASQYLKQRCAVMENGKLRFVLDVEPLDEKTQDSKSKDDEDRKVNWALSQMRKDDKANAWLARKQDSGGWKRIVVVKGGKTINFVG